MDKKEYYKNCEKCGRPMTYAKPCECKRECSCLPEYHCPVPACIKHRKPDCLAKAVIPAVTVDSADGITNLANCFVHVTNNNTTYYIDDKHRPMLVWAGTVEVENYDIETNELKLRSQVCYNVDTDSGTGTLVYFDKRGVGHVIQEEA